LVLMLVDGYARSRKNSHSSKISKVRVRSPIGHALVAQKCLPKRV